jgi:chromosome segregation ATPase
MVFFTIGNLLTLGIVAAVLLLYRQFDRHNRALDKVHKYVDKLKDDLSVFVEEREEAVKDYGLALKVEQDAAKELMNRLKETGQGFEEKAETVAKIDDRLNEYDHTLEKLVRMTARVQENLNRIREESAFVEGANKKISEAKDRLGGIEKHLGELELRFERENAEALEKAAEEVTAVVRTAVSDLAAAAETIERRVEDHREAVDKIEQGRAVNLARDVEIINKALKDAVERAGIRADKMEEAALVKLREQAQERIRRLQAAEEEKLKDYHENAKVRVAEVRNLVKSVKEDWKNERAELEMRDRNYRDEWKKNIQELNGIAKAQKEAWAAAAGEGDAKSRQILTALEASSLEAQKRISGEIVAAGEQLKEFKAGMMESVSRIEAEMSGVVAEAEKKALAAAEGELEKWKQTIRELNDVARSQKEAWAAAAGEGDAKSRQILAALEASSLEAQNHISGEITAAEERLAVFRKDLDKTVFRIEAEMSGVVAEAEKKALATAEEELEKWKQTLRELNDVARSQKEAWAAAAGEGDAKSRQILAALEASSAEIQKRVSGEIAAAEERFAVFRDGIDGTAARIEADLARMAKETEKKALAAAEALEKQLKDTEVHAGETVSALEQRLAKTIRDREQKILEESDARFEEYRTVQIQQWKQFETLADDSARLDTELRRYMKETEDRVREDFALFERDAARAREGAAGEFNASLAALRSDIDGVEKNLAVLKTSAYENVSEKLKVFEDEFFADLSKRSESIETRLNEWQASLDSKLAGLAEEAAAERRNLELSFTEGMRTRLSEQDERLNSELEHLKHETGAFEEGIREEMRVADESLDSFKEQLNRNLEDTRTSAEVSIKAEIGKYALSSAGAFKQHQRELDARLKEITAQVENRSDELTALLDSSRRDIDEWQSGFTSQLRDLDASMDEVRRRTRELAAQSDERLVSIRSAIEDVHVEADSHRAEIFSRTEEHAKSLDAAIKDADRHIKEFIGQTKLFDQADELKLELERRIEDLRGDLDRLDQRRSEAAQLESQFVKIKRLEDEVSAKMSRFMSEKHRIEQMETDFNRLLQTSKAVEEKLAQVSSSDDTLQAVQLELRRLNDVIDDAEEKYRRIDKKKQALDATNDGIDRNFKALQESENEVRQINEELGRFSDEIGRIRSSIEKLAGENEKARETTEKLSLLDESLSAIEERIRDMQIAREWIARAETRLDELNRDVQSKLNLAGGLLKKNSPKTSVSGKGAPPIGVREDIIRLARQGWTVDQISNAMKVSPGEVELTLETIPKE